LKLLWLWKDTASSGLLYPKDKIEILGENPKKLITPHHPHDIFENQRLWKR